MTISTTDKPHAALKKHQTLAQVSDAVTVHRAQGRKVVLCHGVFDLLHIGHIRHFQEARKNGDVLVVTITPDRFVNKGPHRPVFSETLRAEAVAALDCVDHVAINEAALAIEAIKLLRPNYYVKGSDYRDVEKDVTGGIELEREAVESVGGELVFTDEIVFSSSALINRHLPIFSNELSTYLESFSKKYSAEDVLRYLDLMRPLRVLTIGEAIIDEYQYCHAIGKSSKEPVLVVKNLDCERFAGGILAVANNVANFCGRAGVVSLLGDTESQEEFVKSSLNSAIDAHLLVRRNSPTIVKKRFVENYFFSKLFEVYSINDQPLDVEEDENLCRMLADIVPRYDVIIVVDFGHSMLTESAAKVICDNAKFLAINTQSNAGSLGYQTIYKYRRADYVCITEDEIRLEVRDRASSLAHIIPQLAKDLACEKVVVTRGSRGCTCYSADEGLFEAPAVAGRVVDRMGAGDAFLSITSMVAALKAPPEVLVLIGNAVGAQAVATVGHRESISRPTLSKFITSLLK